MSAHVFDPFAPKNAEVAPTYSYPVQGNQQPPFHYGAPQGAPQPSPTSVANNMMYAANPQAQAPPQAPPQASSLYAPYQTPHPSSLQQHAAPPHGHPVGQAPQQIGSSTRQLPSKTVDVRPHSRIVRSYSNASSLGSRSAGSGYRHGGAEILNDKTFAPPPKSSKSLEVTKSQYFHVNKDIMSTLPSFGSIMHSGDCLARFSLKSMMTKKWRPTFWIAYGNSQIIFFRSRSDFDEWVSNPFLQKVERDKLVKATIDFVNDRYKPNVQGYAISDLTSKAYMRDGYMHHFKLERWYTYGPGVTFAMGGKNENEVRNLRTIMAAMMEVHPQNVDFKQKNAKAISDMSSYYDSESQSGRSFDSRFQRGTPSVASFMTSGSSAYSQKNSSMHQKGRLDLESRKYHAHNERNGPGSGYDTDNSKKRGSRKWPWNKKNEDDSVQYDYDLGPSHPDVQRWKQNAAPVEAQKVRQSQPYQYDLAAHTEEYGFEANRGRGSSKMKKMFRSKSGERAETESKPSLQEHRAKSTGILRNGLFKRRQKEPAPQVPVQYYVGRPSQQQNFHYNPAPM